MFADEPVSIHRCFAAVSRGGDSLSISEISHVSSREYSRYIRFGFITGDNVAFGVQIDLSLEYRSVRFVADSHKHAVRFDQLYLFILDIITPHSCYDYVSLLLLHTL